MSFSAINALILGAAMLLSPFVANAQRRGGGGSSSGGLNGSVSGSNRPTGLDEKDTLKDFHEALAVQATSQQIAEFHALLKSTDTAKAELQAFQQQLGKEKTAESRGAALDQALETARSESKKFQDGFSAEQKSGLKEVSKRLAKADLDLEQEEKKLAQSLEIKAAGPEVSAHTESLDKALTDFSNQLLALGREMSITLASAQDLIFTLPLVKSPARIARQTIAVPVSGTLSQIAAAGTQRTFRLDLIAGLSELQQNITDLLRRQLDRSETCGQRVEVRQASLTPSSPATLLVVRLHYERWTCLQLAGQQTSNELAEDDGTVDVKLTASVGEANTFKLTSELGRIHAGGMMADALRSGSLGDDLRDRITQSLLSAIEAGADFKTTLPPAVQNSATIQSVRFQDDGVGTLSVVLTGQIRISDEQATLLASQLNQALSAQGSPTQ